MNENINLCEILKDCPKGTKFYSTVFGEETYFMGIDPYQGNPRPIIIHGKYGEEMAFQLSRFGHPYADAFGECCLWPSKDVRTWEGWKCTKPKFDPKTLKAFDKVLAWHTVSKIWLPDFYSFCDNNGFTTIGGGFYNIIIPYNEETKHLIGTSDEAPEFYRYWEY